MAEKRMFTQKITDSDAFLEMPLSAQALYFHLNMNADDDGFVNNPKKIQRSICASEDDLKLLVMKRFIIGFDKGVIVIKHWRMHNTLRKDRYNPTQYQEELSMLALKDGKIYTERLPGDSVATTWQPDGNHLAPQYSVVENSVVEESIEEYIEPQAASPAPLAEPDMFGPKLQEAFEDWLKYKKERRESYKETGLRNLVTEIKNNAAKYGEEAVAELIRHSMASNWRGIIFDRLKEQQGRQQSGGGVSFWQMREEASRR